MAKLLISFTEKNVRLGRGALLFRRQWLQRFEWIALLAYKRVTLPADQTWAELNEIAQLPSWEGRSRHDTSTYVGRYLESAELRRSQLVEAVTKWSGPYRLRLNPLSVEFDIPFAEVRNRLQLRPQPSSGAQRAALIRFAHSFARAQWRVFRGRLVSQRPNSAPGRTAYETLKEMAEDRSYNSTYQFLILLATVEVLFRLGRFRAARHKLVENRSRVRKIGDSSLRARYYLKLAWAHQRVSSGRRCDTAVEAALQKADFYAQRSGDRTTLGMLAQRTGGYRTKKGFHEEAIQQMVLAVEADLITGNFDSLQANCGNVGSIVHRLGRKHYREARRWLLLSIAIARMMRLGRDDAHAEAILAKIYIESGDRLRSRWMLQRAERVARNAQNWVNLGDVKMIWGFWYKRFGTREELIATLSEALRIFRRLSEFDVRQKARYMEREFVEVWDEVIARRT